jgi:hypothetical protein
VNNIQRRYLGSNLKGKRGYFGIKINGQRISLLRFPKYMTIIAENEKYLKQFTKKKKHQ